MAVKKLPSRDTDMDTVSADLRFTLDSLQRERTREILRMLDEKSFKQIVKQAETLFLLMDEAGRQHD